MNCFAFMPYVDMPPSELLFLLPPDEARRLASRSPAYALPSAHARLLLFALCDEVLGVGAYQRAVAYRAGTDDGTASHGAPYLLSHPTLSVSVSHTDGACAVMLSDEGAVGVDIENIASVRERSKESLLRISKKMHLDDFQVQTAEFLSKTQIFIYKMTKNGVALAEKSPVFDKISKTESDEFSRFCTLYTRMEALAKATERGVSFLGERERYLTAFDIESVVHYPFYISCAKEK